MQKINLQVIKFKSSEDRPRGIFCAEGFQVAFCTESALQAPRWWFFCLFARVLIYSRQSHCVWMPTRIRRGCFVPGVPVGRSGIAMETSRNGSSSLLLWNVISQLEVVMVGFEEQSSHSSSCFDIWGAWIISGPWRLEAGPLVML